MIPTVIKQSISNCSSCSCGASQFSQNTKPTCSYKIPDISSRPKIADSIGDFSVQLFLCSGVPDSKWPKRMNINFPILNHFKDLSSNTPHFPEIKVTVTDIPSLHNSSTTNNQDSTESLSLLFYDFLVFPHGWRIKNVSSENALGFMELITKSQPTFDPISQSFPPVDPSTLDSPLTQFIDNLYQTSRDWFFICTHQERDYRCGEMGRLIRYSLENSPLAENAVIASTSHIGGHKYAGNIIHWPQGDFFGFIDEETIPPFTSVIQSLHKQPSTETINNLNFGDHWRGRVGFEIDSDSDDDIQQDDTIKIADEP